MFRILFSLSLVAGTAGLLPARTFTMESAVAQAVRTNPDLAAARWSVEQARARLQQSGRAANPSVEAEIKPNIRGREGAYSLGFVQKFPLTNRLHLERAVSQAELTAAGAEVRNAERLLKAEVRAAAIKMLALDGKKALNDKQRKNSTELLESSIDTAKKGEGSPLDASHFELELQQLDLELLKAQRERAELNGTLRVLLGLTPAETVTISGTLAEPAAARGTAVPEQRADYQAAKAKEDAALTGIAAAQAGKWDDMEVGLTYEQERTDDAGAGLEKEHFLGLRFSIPLPLWNKNEGRVREARAAAARAGSERAALASRIRSEAEAARAEMTVAAKIAQDTAGPLLKKALELEERHLAANKLGQSPMTDVLRSRERRFTLESEHLDALVEYHLARVRLLSAQGQ